MLKRTAILLMAIILLSVSLVSCKKEEQKEDVTETVYYTVTFNSNGGTAVNSQRVAAGAKVPEPTIPEYTNYVFDKWIYNGKAWDFAYDTVKEDITLSAQWISADAVYTFEIVEGTDNAVITGLKKSSLDIPKNLALPSSINNRTVTGVADEAFKDTSYEDVYSFTLGEGIVSIGNSAFEGCADIEITVKGALTNIGELAFSSCNMLKSVTFGDGLEKISIEAFAASGITSAFLPASLKLIDEDAFKACASLTVLVVCPVADEANADTVIANSAFRECSNIKTVFFKGNADELDVLLECVADGNECFTEARFSLYSETEPTDDGSFWYMSGNEPREW